MLAFQALGAQPVQAATLLDGIEAQGLGQCRWKHQ
jgi:hypothetical protein